ncbi:MAG: PstS family phosphate ABC transporter substrate-binding protein [Planctomycetota bacterium]
MHFAWWIVLLSLVLQDPAPVLPPVAAPADVASPGAVVEALYATISGAAGQARDWRRLRSLFAAEGRLVAMVKARDAGTRAMVLTVDDYVRRAGPQAERDGFFEQEVARQEQVFGDIAHVFSTYECRRAAADATPFLRGINSIHLVRSDGRWQLLQVLWEQEAEAGPIPAEFLVGKPSVAKQPVASTLPRLQVRVRGSDTMLDLAQQWTAGYLGAAGNLVAAGYPGDAANVAFEVFGGGTSVGFQAFAANKVEVALAMRRLGDGELADARALGAEPLEVCIGYVAYAVCVHASNPLSSLRQDQLRDLYLEGGSATKWSQLGVTLPAGTPDEVALLSREPNSGSGVNFKLVVLGRGNMRRDTYELTGDKDVIDLVQRTPNAIGFAELSRIGKQVKVLPIAAAADKPAVLPTPATCADGSYPLARPAYVYYRDEPTGRVKAFVRWLSSAEGRALLEQAGILPTK